MTDSITPEGSSEGALADEGFSGRVASEGNGIETTPTETQLPDSDTVSDTVLADAMAKETVTNDAVAGETVLPDGPTEAEDDREGRDYGQGDADELLPEGAGTGAIAGETALPSGLDGDTEGEAQPDPTIPPGPDAATDASEPVGESDPLDLRDEDD